MTAARRLARLEAGPLGDHRRESDALAAQLIARGRELQRLRAAGRGEPYEAMGDIELILEMVGQRPERAHRAEIARRYEEPSDDEERTAFRAIIDYFLTKTGEA
jgi:hypothetical protein